MDLRTGTSGFAYPQWRGSFYPADLKNDAMLSYYAARLATVEINNTFYRMPKPAVVQSWLAAVPAHFTFTIKASQRITHFAKLTGEDAAKSMAYLWQVLTEASALPQLACVLLQTPPYLRCNDAALTALTTLAALAPAGARVAWELAHHSWANAEVASVLFPRGQTVVVADKDTGTFDWQAPVYQDQPCAYVRLRRDNYTSAEIQHWLDTLAARQPADAYGYFKHEDTARGAEMALECAALAARRTPPSQ